MQRILLFTILNVVFSTNAQNIKIQPYLQNAEPSSISIFWETDSGEESIVEWGLTNSLGNSTSGVAIQTQGSDRLHEVLIEGLTKFTTYYYRVKTEGVFSEIFTFKTPPFKSDNESFSIVALSDMQRDGSHPNKFSEIINQGIITYLENEFGGDLIDNLALALIPGDLVPNGNTFSQWEEYFFNPSENLFSHIPVYPVLGNHENDTDYYFMYFKLPENGTSGEEEHWWYKDYSNLRIIGLDSNNGYRTQEQLDWLENILDESCSDPDIDFVFAQLHHPFKSELWIPGELDYTGDVITLLENFTTQCNKPSIHFFGHTHGYSRGQSRDHKHLWINVATAGGAIDHWGDFSQFDYDVFSKSQDEWGFVTVDVTAGDNPKFVVKRISRGNEENFRDNEVTDSITVRLNTLEVTIPLGIFPNNEEVIPECVILKGSDFSSGDEGAFHGQSHWQIANNCDFTNLVSESWKNFENFYFEINTQEEDDLTDEKFTGLSENNSYCWRVRYRDRELNWSSWSIPLEFTTGDSQLSENLLQNPGAEEDLDQWQIIEGVVEALTDGECNGISPNSGIKYFAVGGLCEESEFAKLVQNADVTSFSSDIDTGNFDANFGGFLSNFSGSDLPEMKLIFLDENDNELGTSSTFSTLSNNWTSFNEFESIPELTRTIQFELTGTRNGGTDNDSYFDDLFLKIGEETDLCSQIILSVPTTINSFVSTLKVIPNPWSETSSIVLPNRTFSEITLIVSNVLGQKVTVPFQIEKGSIILQKGNLKSGVYFFVISEGNTTLGKGKFIVK